MARYGTMGTMDTNWLGGLRSVQRAAAKREAEERDRQAWIEDVKHRFGLRTIGSDEGPQPVWPVVEEGARYEVVGEWAMASYDGVNFYVKPEGMPLIEFWDSIPKRRG